MVLTILSMFHQSVLYTIRRKIMIKKIKIGSIHISRLNYLILLLFLADSTLSQVYTLDYHVNTSVIAESDLVRFFLEKEITAKNPNQLRIEYLDDIFRHGISFSYPFSIMISFKEYKPYCFYVNDFAPPILCSEIHSGRQYPYLVSFLCNGKTIRERKFSINKNKYIDNLTYDYDSNNPSNNVWNKTTADYLNAYYMLFNYINIKKSGQEPLDQFLEDYKVINTKEMIILTYDNQKKGQEKTIKKISFQKEGSEYILKNLDFMIKKSSNISLNIQTMLINNNINEDNVLQWNIKQEMLSEN